MKKIAALIALSVLLLGCPPQNDGRPPATAAEVQP